MMQFSSARALTVSSPAITQLAGRPALVPGKRITAGSCEQSEYDHIRTKLCLQAQALSANIHMLAKLKINLKALCIDIEASDEFTVNGEAGNTRGHAGGLEHGSCRKWAAHATSQSMSSSKKKSVTMPGFLMALPKDCLQKESSHQEGVVQ